MAHSELTPETLVAASLAHMWSADGPELCYAESAAAWSALQPEERCWLGRVIKAFSSGETAVADELYFLFQPLERLGMSDARNYVAMHIVEELRHHRFFSKWSAAVGLDLDTIETSAGIPERHHLLRRMELNLRKLRDDHSPEALAKAIAAYHFATEGITGLTLLPVLSEIARLHPGFSALRVGAHYLHQDEARHIAFGTYLARRLIANFGERIAELIDAELSAFNAAAKRAVLIGFEEVTASHQSCFGITAASLLEKADLHRKNRKRHLYPAEAV